jgi:hypothetical protein
MDWASQRRFTIVAIIIAVALVILAVTLTATLYAPPSCVDHKQNQDEFGIDCGGSCPYLCNVQEEPPSTPTPRLLRNSAGRTDLVASVQNRNNSAAAKNIPYVIKLYDADLSFVRSIEGTLDLPPRATVPIFIPGVAFGGRPGIHASLEIASTSAKWYTMTADPRILPKVAVKPPSGTIAAPRIEAVLSNQSLTTLSKVHVVALVHDGLNGNVIAASETVIPVIYPQAMATAVFTWNEPFSSSSVTVEVLPVIPLP